MGRHKNSINACDGVKPLFTLIVHPINDGSAKKSERHIIRRSACVRNAFHYLGWASVWQSMVTSVPEGAPTSWLGTKSGRKRFVSTVPGCGVLCGGATYPKSSVKLYKVKKWSGEIIRSRWIIKTFEQAIKAKIGLGTKLTFNIQNNPLWNRGWHSVLSESRRN